MASEDKRIRLSSEAAYLIGILGLSFSVAMAAAADFGVSMIVAPAYILSLKFDFLTFGQAEYVLQAIIFVIFCILMKKVRAVYFSSFVTCIIYGAVLDGWRAAIPLFNPAVISPSDIGIPLKIGLFAASMIITAFCISLFFRIYLYPQVYDFFVKLISVRFGIDRTKFKIGYDVFSLLLSVALTLIFFGEFRGIGIGTLILTLFNGILIDLAGKVWDKYFLFEPKFPKLAAHFED